MTHHHFKSSLKPLFTSLLFVFSLQFASPAVAKANDVADAQNRVLSVTRNISKDLQVNKILYTSNTAKLTTMIRQKVLPFFDFDAMSKLTLGKYWKTASAVQKKRFINAYREMLIRSYGKTMLKYSGAEVRPARSAAKTKAGYVTVRTKVFPKGSAAVTANYDMRKKLNIWKAYNIEVAGLSLITNFRTSFTREVSAKGLDALIKRLEKTKK